MNAVGKNLKQLRQREKLTQDALAERLHVTRQAVSSWETGKTQPDIETLTALAEALHADVRELIYGPGRIERPYADRAALCPVSAAVHYLHGHLCFDTAGMACDGMDAGAVSDAASDGGI